MRFVTLVTFLISASFALASATEPAEKYQFTFGEIAPNYFSLRDREKDTLFSVKIQYTTGVERAIGLSLRKSELEEMRKYLGAQDIFDLTGKTFESELKYADVALDRFKFVAKSKGLYVPPAPTKVHEVITTTLVGAALGGECIRLRDVMDDQAVYEGMIAIHDGSGIVTPEWYQGFESKVSSLSQGQLTVRPATDEEAFLRPANNFVIEKNGTPVLKFILAKASNGFECKKVNMTK